ALRDAYKNGEIEDAGEVLPFLKDKIKEDLEHWDTDLHLPEDELGVILVAGVNGSGKTTSIGKLSHKFEREGKEVLLAASDTFRAAAVEQLNIWARDTGADIVKNETADPAAVAFDAIDKATSGDYDVLIIDTAGRVHTRQNLMDELAKISRVVSKKLPEAPHETLLVLDATTGQNGISQAIKFDETLDVSGLILAKLDGTAKGGIVFGMRDQIDIPVKFIGVGQQKTDLAPFEPDDFVDALFA
ncbi:MAG: signal recognition particle-docking protein FtsY, partial [Planctomycetota bacterium]